jgi:hypothetical protein
VGHPTNAIDVLFHPQLGGLILSYFPLVEQLALRLVNRSWHFTVEEFYRDEFVEVYFSAAALALPTRGAQFTTIPLWARVAQFPKGVRPYYSGFTNPNNPVHRDGEELRKVGSIRTVPHLFSRLLCSSGTSGMHADRRTASGSSEFVQRIIDLMAYIINPANHTSLSEVMSTTLTSKLSTESGDSVHTYPSDAGQDAAALPTTKPQSTKESESIPPPKLLICIDSPKANASVAKLRVTDYIVDDILFAVSPPAYISSRLHTVIVSVLCLSVSAGSTPSSRHAEGARIIPNDFLKECRTIHRVVFTDEELADCQRDSDGQALSSKSGSQRRSKVTIVAIGDFFLYNCDQLESCDMSALVYHQIGTIGRGFLFGTSKLKEIDLACLHSCTFIGDNFMLQSGLLRVDLSPLPTYLTTIGGAFLQGCTNLTEVIFPPTLPRLVTLPASFLRRCTAIKRLSLNCFINVTKIGPNFLLGCTSLEALEGLPTVLITVSSSIGEGFLYQTGLQSIDLGGLSSTAVFEDRALFAQCRLLKTVQVWSNIEVTKIRDRLPKGVEIVRDTSSLPAFEITDRTEVITSKPNNGE